MSLAMDKEKKSPLLQPLAVPHCILDYLSFFFKQPQIDCQNKNSNTEGKGSLHERI